jgi:hypothetical protein
VEESRAALDNPNPPQRVGQLQVVSLACQRPGAGGRLAPWASSLHALLERLSGSGANGSRPTPTLPFSQVRAL